MGDAVLARDQDFYECEMLGTHELRVLREKDFVKWSRTEAVRQSCMLVLCYVTCVWSRNSYVFTMHATAIHHIHQLLGLQYHPTNTSANSQTLHWIIHNRASDAAPLACSWRWTSSSTASGGRIPPVVSGYDIPFLPYYC